MFGRMRLPTRRGSSIASVSRPSSCDALWPFYVRSAAPGRRPKAWRGQDASQPPHEHTASTSAELDARISKEVRALSDTCALHQLVETNVKTWRASRQGRDGIDEIEKIAFLPRGSTHAGLGDELLASDAS